MIAKKAFTKVSAKYADFGNIFFLDFVFKLLEHIRIKEYAIKLINNKQPIYRPIYSLEPIELDTLKTYIKINLVNKFIRLFKLPAYALIFFDRKSNRFFQLCFNYKSLYNLMIKNRYLLSLVEKLLDRLKRTRQFTQPKLINAYY